MNATMQHLIVEMLEGHADLVVEGLPAIKGLSIRFDPQRLCIEVWLSDLSPVVGELAWQVKQRRSPPIRLINVVLRTCEPKRTLRANELVLYPSSSIKEWPEISGESDDTESRRLELEPSSSKALAFVSDELISKEHPYQVYYGGACTGFKVPRSLRHPSLPSEVFLHRDHPMSGVLRASSAEDFFAQEPRLHAAWCLIHGRRLLPVLKVKQREVCFYGNKPDARHEYMPLVNAQDMELPESVMHGFLHLESKAFEDARFALQYFLAGKDSDVSLELRYLMLMSCVDAMDGEKIGQLKERTTAAMLGVSPDAARLFNGMRNKLTHRALGYRQAFARVDVPPFSVALGFGVRGLI